MRTNEIIKVIQRLPIQKRIYVIEKAIHSIRKQEDTNQMNIAADTIYTDYKSDKKLTAFTDLDFEDFYETR
jgi:nucleoside diphosphate kinase